MTDKKVKHEATPEQTALKTLKQRMNTISVGVENLDIAENRTPDNNIETDNSATDRLVNVGNTPTDPEANNSKTGRLSLDQIYNSMKETV